LLAAALELLDDVVHVRLVDLWIYLDIGHAQLQRVLICLVATLSEVLGLFVLIVVDLGLLVVIHQILYHCSCYGILLCGKAGGLMQFTIMVSSTKSL